MWRGYDKQVIKDICYNFDSPVSKKSASYIDYMQRCLPADKVWCECFDGKAFYFATVAKSHARLIEIAVRNGHKGHGIGRKVLFRLLSRMKKAGLSKLTFRTPIDERAADFWLHVGAIITGLKDNDYEMEINIR